jgi:ubiquinone/menaquinone biosynthesis C-methylase UbiE
MMTNKPHRLDMDYDLQDGSKHWWDQNPMSYDWRKTVAEAEGTGEFFDEIDRRFFASSPYYKGIRPFDRLIDFNNLKGKKVLEIGCGLGAHAQLLADTGCNLTAIDFTLRAVQMTQRRLALRGLNAEVRLMNAEQLQFPDQTFDFVWSWGVIHHSAHPEKIVEEVYRVLRPSGEFRVMVYHRRSLNACTSVARGILSGKVFKGMRLSDILSYYSDGYIARFYTRSELFRMLLNCGFGMVVTQVLGQKNELVPLPGTGLIGRLKSAFVAQVPDKVAESILSRVGGFLFAVARKDPA